MGRTLVNLPEYEITGRIGTGAGAIIYSALHRSTRKPFAVKHVVRHGPQDDRFLDQAENEYEVARQFDVPSLRKCVELVRVRRWLKIRELFLVMELVEGPRLHDLYEAERPNPLERAVVVFIRIAEALAAMHARGYVHADTKPKNIMLPTPRSVKLIDFGQSCPMGHQKARIQGTPDFIAPEQVLLKPLDQRTDVFNLGATMYWAVTGKAFSTILPNAPVASKKITLDARRGNEPPIELNADVPLPLSRLIMECCESDMASRPWDMAKVISRLETVLHLLAQKSAADPGERPSRAVSSKKPH